MNTIYFDSTVTDEERRKRLYEGQVFVFSPLASSIALCEFAREMVQDAFGSVDAREAEYRLSTDEYVAILAKLKPKFVHHPQSKQLLQRLLGEMGCDLSKTYLDVPRLKTIPNVGRHSSGLTYAIHPHRDTWYSAPFCQLNWWLPIYDIGSANALAFHPRYWSQPVRNGSTRFNHYRWNKYGRKAAADDPEKYLQDQPCPEEPIELELQVRLISPAGGILLFSGAQLHSAVPNTSGQTRFSIDFRTVHLDDVLNKVGAPNIDSAATGTSLRDFLRGTDLSRIPDEIAGLYDTEPLEDGELVFKPQVPDAFSR
jgi:Phytanoyl-CoA dioxygenase (PhyH)